MAKQCTCLLVNRIINQEYRIGAQACPVHQSKPKNGDGPATKTKTPSKSEQGKEVNH